MFLPKRIPAVRLLVRNALVLDPRTGRLSPPSDILLDRGLVEAIAPSGGLPADGATPLDAGGRVALPGLIDCHLHAAGIYLQSLPAPADYLWIPRQIVRNLKALAESGVTTVRDMAGPIRLLRWLDGLGRDGRIAAPRLLLPGPMLTAPGGYPPFIEPLPRPVAWALGQLKAELTTEAQGRGWVDGLARAGADFVKVGYTSIDYDDARTPIPRIPDRILRAVTERAHHHNLPVAVHHVWAADLGPLLELPFDTLEHLTIDEEIGKREVKRIRERKLPVTTTLLAYGIADFVEEMIGLVERDAEGRFERKARQSLAKVLGELSARTFRVPFIGRRVIETGMTFMLRNLARLAQGGVLVGAGTDSGGAITPCGKISWELRSFRRAGLTALDAVRAATSDAARVIGRTDLGLLEPGKRADLVLCRGNPAGDISALDAIDLVVRDCRILKDRLGTGTGAGNGATS